MRVVVLGSTGMLGWMVNRVLSQEDSFEVFGTQSENPDNSSYFDALSNIETLEPIIRGSQYIINCIGITKNLIHEQDIQSVERAFEINSKFPYRLATLAKEHGARVIQISTNGVFLGERLSYNERDVPDATDVYGKSKAQGEVQQENFLNLRCSIVGPSPIKKAGLFEWFKLQQEGSTIQGFTNHAWNGVTTLQFAQLCRTIITGDHFDRLRNESWVHHFVPNSTVSKYELLKLFQSALKKFITINPVEDQKGGGSSPILDTQLQTLQQVFPNAGSLEHTIRDLCAQSVHQQLKSKIL